jgi:peroxiredoxin
MRTLSSILVIVCFLIISATTSGYEPGDKVADFSLKNVDGKMVALSGFEDAKGVIVVFDCNTCPYSKLYNSRIVALNKKYKSQGFPVVAINANDSEMSPGDSYEEMVKVAKRDNYDFPYLIDESQATAKAFGASNTPHVFVLQKTGSEFTVIYKGAIDNNPRDGASASKKYVEEAVDAVLNNQVVVTKKTKAIGCGIKYRNS